MDQQALYGFIFISIFLVLTGISHALYRFFHVPSSISRKFLHVSGGLLALAGPLFFDSHWWVLGICMTAFLFLLFTYIKQWLPAVHDAKRISIGSVIFPLPIYICFFAAREMNNELFFYLPISYLTISDTVAELAGKKWGMNSLQFMRGQKTMIGSIAFAISAFIIAMVWGLIFKLEFQQLLLISILTTLLATFTELISTKGWDNLTVPAITLLGLMILL